MPCLSQSAGASGGRLGLASTASVMHPVLDNGWWQSDAAARDGQAMKCLLAGQGGCYGPADAKEERRAMTRPFHPPVPVFDPARGLLANDHFQMGYVTND